MKITREQAETVPDGLYWLDEAPRPFVEYDSVNDLWVLFEGRWAARIDDGKEIPENCEFAGFRPDGKRLVICSREIGREGEEDCPQGLINGKPWPAECPRCKQTKTFESNKISCGCDWAKILGLPEKETVLV